MTLLELSEEYEKSADLLRKRLAELRRLKVVTSDPEELWHIKMRIKQLTPILTDTNRLVKLLRHYYDRGYYRSELFTVNGIRTGLEKGTTKKSACEDCFGTTDGIPKGYATSSYSKGRETDRVRKKKRSQQKYSVQDTATSFGKGQAVQPVSMNDEAMEKLCAFLGTSDI